VLPAINDNDGSGSFVKGLIAGPDDVDWYRYSGTDDLIYVVDPFRGFTVEGDSLRVCAYYECTSGTAKLGEQITPHTCPTGTEAVSSNGGRPGCCTLPGTTEFGFEIPPDDIGIVCDGTILYDNMYVYLRVDAYDGAAADTCEPYTLAYHY